MSVKIVPFDIRNDDVDRVAWLFYVTDPEIMGLFFGKEKPAILMIKKLISLDKNHFSHKYIKCAKENNEIIGIMAGFDGKTNYVIDNNCAQDYFAALGPFYAMRAGLVALFMQSFFKSSIDEDEFYVNNLCVAPDKRSSGIGAALLNEAFKNYKKVSLGVNANNVRGMKFYQKNNLKVESGRKIKLFNKTFGAYHMVWKSEGNCCGSK